MEIINTTDAEFKTPLNKYPMLSYVGVESSICSTTPSGFVVSPLDGKFSSSMSIIITPQGYSKPHIDLLVSDQLRDILGYYGLSKSDLARILGVSRPAVYAWLDGQSEPSTDNLLVIQKLYSIVEPPEQGTWTSVFHGYIERPITPFKKSLIDMLSDPKIDSNEVRDVVKALRQMSQKRSEKFSESEAKARVVHTKESQNRILDENLLGISSEE